MKRKNNRLETSVLRRGVFVTLLLVVGLLTRVAERHNSHSKPCPTFPLRCSSCEPFQSLIPIIPACAMNDQLDVNSVYTPPDYLYLLIYLLLLLIGYVRVHMCFYSFADVLLCK